MEVVEFEPQRAMGWLVHDGPFTIRSRTTFEPLEDGGTSMTTSVELPDNVKALDRSIVERSMRTMKALIEAET